jgi:hypothetical protein
MSEEIENQIKRLGEIWELLAIIHDRQEGRMDDEDYTFIMDELTDVMDTLGGNP